MLSSWRDAIMFSTYYNNNIKVIEKRENNNRTLKIPKPVVICGYSRDTLPYGCIDEADQFISACKYPWKLVKWCEKIFFWLLDESIKKQLYTLQSAQPEQRRQTNLHS